VAKLGDSEAVIWRQAENIRLLRGEYLAMQAVVAVLARRQAGVLLISPEELMRLPSGTVIHSSRRDDGTMVIRVVTGEPGQPGSAG